MDKRLRECFVTIKVFARTEHMYEDDTKYYRFVTIRIFARTDLKKEKGSDTPPERAEGGFPPTFYCVNVN